VVRCRRRIRRAVPCCGACARSVAKHAKKRRGSSCIPYLQYLCSLPSVVLIDLVQPLAARFHLKLRVQEPRGFAIVMDGPGIRSLHTWYIG
jgi:hypothetical protein